MVINSAVIALNAYLMGPETPKPPLKQAQAIMAMAREQASLPETPRQSSDQGLPLGTPSIAPSRSQYDLVRKS